tara:strand:+ start:241 stop:618 length:378 start_codon:yes stop_codon:yes gene_type:complete
MRLLFLAFLISLSTSAFGEMNNNRLRILLNICDAAQKSADLGTVRNIASQIQGINSPENKQLADRFNKCIHMAFGETEKKPDVNELVTSIEKTYSKLEEDCRVLLRTAPEIAIVHPICKPVITSP